MKKIVLCILDGVGISDNTYGNAFSNAKMPNYHYLYEHYPHTELKASGVAVGLPEGQMGNSEVGHLNIGAGRIVNQDLLRINQSIKDGSFYENPCFLKAINNCKEHQTNLHIMGMLSDGKIHSDLNHLFALLELCKKENFSRVYLHLILDGRDTLECAALKYLEMLNKKIEELHIGEILTIEGRYYIMNRDRNWELTRLGYEAIVDGISEYQMDNAYEAINHFYKENITDEFIKPVIIKSVPIKENDSIISYNYRSDRMIQFTRALFNPEFNDFERKKGYIKTCYVTMTKYEEESYTKGILVAFKEEIVKNSIGEYLSNLGYKQKRISEYEKRLHITFYLNGMNLKPFAKEVDQIYPRQDVFTYDLAPQMRSYEITDDIIASLKEDYDVIFVNYPNGDAVGHSGIYEKAKEAMEHLDKCLGKLIQETNLDDYILILTADHGNCECMYESDGTPNKKHTTNPVPFIVCEKGLKLKEGSLSNIAPTILDLMGLECSDMTSSLIIK